MRDKSIFLGGQPRRHPKGVGSCHPTNSVKALKGKLSFYIHLIFNNLQLENFHDSPLTHKHKHDKLLNQPIMQCEISAHSLF